LPRPTRPTARASPPPALPPQGYAFLELRTVEEASNAMAFDGVQFKDTNLKVGAAPLGARTRAAGRPPPFVQRRRLPRAGCRPPQTRARLCGSFPTPRAARPPPPPRQIRRPSNYDAAAALLLGPAAPDPTLVLDHLKMCKTVVEDSWSKVFVGGLPSDWTDDQVGGLGGLAWGGGGGGAAGRRGHPQAAFAGAAPAGAPSPGPANAHANPHSPPPPPGDQVKELLKPYGQLKSFNLVMDKATGKSKVRHRSPARGRGAVAAAARAALPGAPGPRPAPPAAPRPDEHPNSPLQSAPPRPSRPPPAAGLLLLRV
jgi:hypothetical protein